MDDIINGRIVQYKTLRTDDDERPPSIATKKRYSLTIQGKHRSWCFLIYGTPLDYGDWLRDGLGVAEAAEVIPARAVTVNQWRRRREEARRRILRRTP